MKKGITVSTLTIAIVIMLILVSTATVIGIKSIQTASYEEFVSKLERVSSDVNAYVLEYDELPTTSEIVSKEGLPKELRAEIDANQDNYNNLYVIDMNDIRSAGVKIGYGSISDLDIFLVAENTNNVYYYKGAVYKGNTYHGIKK